MKWISLAAVLLVLLTGCNRPAPVVTAPTTAASTTTTSPYTGATFLTTTTTAAADRNVWPATTTTTTDAAVITTTTTTTTANVTTTTTAKVDEFTAMLQPVAAFACVLGPFESVDDLSSERVAEALYAYGSVLTDEFDAYTTELPPKTVIRIPLETVDALCMRFLGRTYSMETLAFAFGDDAVEVEFADKALTFTQIAGYGVDGEFLCVEKETHGKTVKITLYDAYRLPDGYAGTYTEINGKRYEIKGKYTLTVHRNGNQLQLVSLKAIA